MHWVFVVAWGNLCCTDSLVEELGLSCSRACGLLVPRRVGPASPALQGRFLTPGPPGKSLFLSFNFNVSPVYPGTFLVAQMVKNLVKNLPAVQEIQVGSLGWGHPWRREWLPTPVFLLGEFCVQRSLPGYSPWGRKESDS